MSTAPAVVGVIHQVRTGSASRGTVHLWACARAGAGSPGAHFIRSTHFVAATAVCRVGIDIDAVVSGPVAVLESLRDTDVRAGPVVADLGRGALDLTHATVLGVDLRVRAIRAAVHEAGVAAFADSQAAILSVVARVAARSAVRVIRRVVHAVAVADDPVSWTDADGALARCPRRTDVAAAPAAERAARDIDTASPAVLLS